MPIAITVKADGESPIIALMEHLVGYDKKAMFDEIGAYGVSSTQMRFVDQSDVDGNPWKQSWRARLQNGQTLRDTGRLMNSMTHNVLDNGVEWGTNVEYAATMHYGATIYPKTAGYLVFQVAGNWRKVKKVEIEPRTFLGINNEDDESILNIIGRHISG
ncbi:MULTISPECIES: phage virion morphogenesis protein [unclassified Acinetobacter]|uniref:phage virion morphogenesis protein n=1 Tax=unclassified Acinetobacter TaxID=196816 RepID=UPI00244BE8DE|nr:MULTISPECIES: phage virion morphogenesis protein [unclassified Acinetobacter]MDH0031342.1 phage virion morphogenesis protein [Acinetobacter sp. GD04021]MDH0887173.1 phage virion morphogenesis protein [Acinetobacter sp. GD03873]MDH1083538.1 phage virion morphogenesis protein [Acinetobacter sp. GD03983]MDH2190489.1 phage virion morphogenesis protein [Acinetobacter sp. GD03645]MDH2204065.1 phage virion morphogenesis protein [Acinetobacter sp. GD03647]